MNYEKCHIQNILVAAGTKFLLLAIPWVPTPCGQDKFIP